MYYLLNKIWQAVVSFSTQIGSILKAVQALQTQQQTQQQALQRMEASLKQIYDALIPGPAVKFIFIAEMEGQVFRNRRCLRLPRRLPLRCPRFS